VASVYLVYLGRLVGKMFSSPDVLLVKMPMVVYLEELKVVKMVKVTCWEAVQETLSVTVCLIA
jgi:hypothetical protein